jgi:monolysocardiolipin acyltransferase
LIKNREQGRALITVANHDSCLDDPLVISGSLPLRLFRSEKCRWSLGAKEVCHKTELQKKFFCFGQVIPIIRGDGIYQTAMNFAVEELKKGAWLHIFPEGT